MKKKTNSINVFYIKDEYKTLASEKEVTTFADKVLEYENLSNKSLSISFVSEDMIKSLNRDFRGIDESTDILSFAECDSDVPFYGDKSPYQYMGDILICPEVLYRNSEEFSVTKDEELHRLIVHGMLHLTGMDHSSNNYSEPMLLHQEEILNCLYKKSVQEDLK